MVVCEILEDLMKSWKNLGKNLESLLERYLRSLLQALARRFCKISSKIF